MSPDEMLSVYQRHRAAEDARDFAAVMETLTDDCFLEHVSLGLRSDGKQNATRAYEELFDAFPDLGPIPGASRTAAMCSWRSGACTARCEEHGSASSRPVGSSRSRSSTSSRFRDGLVHGERLFYDAATLCDHAGLDVRLRAAAARAR